MEALSAEDDDGYWKGLSAPSYWAEFLLEVER